MSAEMWIKLAMFMGLVCACSLCGLAASGHFPRQPRAPGPAVTTSAAILFGSMAVSAVCAAVGLAVAARSLPWPAAVIGAGLVLLTAPLLLRALPDHFVDGDAALLVSAVAAVLFATTILLV